MEFMGLSIVMIVPAVAAGAWLGLKVLAPRTEAKWDDQLIDIVEGTAEALNVNPDDLAHKSLGRLKQKIVKR